MLSTSARLLRLATLLQSRRHWPGAALSEELGVDARTVRRDVDRLRELFEVEGDLPPRESIVVVQFGGQRAGIVVDQLMGEFQTVIKPLGRLFANLRGIGGSTILGSGEVALILDVAALVNAVSRAEEDRWQPNRHNSSFLALQNSSSAVQSGR